MQTVAVRWLLLLRRHHPQWGVYNAGGWGEEMIDRPGFQVLMPFQSELRVVAIGCASIQSNGHLAVQRGLPIREPVQQHNRNSLLN